MEQLRRTLTQGDRSTWLVFGGGSVLMTIYVIFGHHSFYSRHLAGPLFGNDAYNDWYRHLYQFLAADLLLLLLPALAAYAWLKLSPRSLGVCLGDWRFGLKATALGIVLLTPLMYIGSFDAAIQGEYPLTRLAGCATDLFILWELCYLLYYIAWEFFFRGFTLFALESKLGATAAILYQIVPSTILHIGKPPGEIAAAVVGGLLLGALAIRTRSMLYPLLLHWYVGASTDFFSLLNMPR